MFKGTFARKRIVWAGAAIIIVALSAIAVLTVRARSAAAPAAVAFSDFLHDVQGGRVAAVTVASDGVFFERRDGGRFRTVAPAGYIASNPTFVSELTSRGVRLDVTQPASSNAGRYAAIAIGFFFFALLGLALMRMMTGRVPTLERTRTIDPE